ncbi:hypothetical protein [Intestinicryptomonas porci]|uniref:Uncharacterized protein n=1 Tax=Intestinicryptomonas porci TaxID=2926320 RepID=A0ABU4WEZ7_9BACT|nr:hypothetical protein [Opitutales bacterium CLA-KB-P66]
MKFKLFLILAFLFSFTSLFGDIYWYDNLGEVLSNAKTENKTVLFFISPDVNRKVKMAPIFKSESFINFAEKNLLCCKANIVLVGGKYKFLNKEIGAFLSKMIPSNATVSENNPIIILFRYPNEYHYVRDFTSFKTEMFEMTSLGFEIKNFISTKENNRVESEHFSYELKSMDFEELKEMYSTSDKLVIFVCSTNPEETVENSPIFQFRDFYDFSMKNLILVPLEIKVPRSSKMLYFSNVRFLKSDYAKFFKKNFSHSFAVSANPEILLCWHKNGGLHKLETDFSSGRYDMSDFMSRLKSCASENKISKNPVKKGSKNGKVRNTLF